MGTKGETPDTDKDEPTSHRASPRPYQERLRGAKWTVAGALVAAVRGELPSHGWFSGLSALKMAANDAGEAENVQSPCRLDFLP